MKARIEAGHVTRVVVGPQIIRAEVSDSVQQEGAAEVWTAKRVPEDETLVPLLEAAGVEYEGTTVSWLSQALGWKGMLPASILNVVVTAGVVLALQAARAIP